MCWVASLQVSVLASQNTSIMEKLCGYNVLAFFQACREHRLLWSWLGGLIVTSDLQCAVRGASYILRRADHVDMTVLVKLIYPFVIAYGHLKRESQLGGVGGHYRQHYPGTGGPGCLKSSSSLSELAGTVCLCFCLKFLSWLSHVTNCNQEV